MTTTLAIVKARLADGRNIADGHVHDLCDEIERLQEALDHTAGFAMSLCLAEGREAAAEITRLRAERAILELEAHDARKDRDAARTEAEQLRAALTLGLRMQEAQKAYFKGRTKEALIASKEIEREFGQTARALLTEDGR